ncbi:MAG: O-antigen ligase family protein [Planctomycetes bacterium]|nr:O-antigen ligase family protein [Planctomycetota bacterium]MBL7043546.1 O-antigen ligase family protein [Pirellulaceae bacterium]
MTRKRSQKRHQQAKRSDETPPVVSGIELARRVALAALVALLVATPLIPSASAAEQGTGTLLILLWLLLLISWLGAGLVLRETRFRFGWIDATVLAFLALHSLSAIMMAGQGHARPTINMLWQWLSFGVCFLLSRQLLRTAAAARAVCAVMVSLAVGLSMLGYYQYFYSMPQLRERYERDPEGVLREARIELEPGSPERKLYEDRLYSTEPTATFALTNSFAGLLAPWLLAAVGIGVCAWSNSRIRWQTIAGVAVCCLVIGFCFLLTKSRTALLAVVVGFVLVAWIRWRGGRRLDWRIFVIGGAAFGLLVAGGIIAGSLDLLVLSETGKSMLYRVQYWQSTMAMIADHPWLGCGPGNFQQYYATYKLPEASETIADPHNFLLEVWATAGTPAMLVFVSVLLLFAWRLVRYGAGGKGGDRVSGVECRVSGDEGREEEGRRLEGTGEDRSADGWTVGCVYGGAVFGVLLAFPCGIVVGFMPDVALLWVGLPVAVACIGLLHAWTVHGTLPVWLPTVAALVLLVNLLAAGGIGFPGVAQSWWLLLAIALGLLDAERPLRSAPRAAATGMVGLAFVLALAFHQTMYQPVLRCQASMNEGDSLAQEGRPDQAKAAYVTAARADPYSADPWMQLASLYRQLAILSGDEEHVGHFDRAVREALARDRRSHSVFRQLGNLRLSLYRKFGDREQLKRAIAAYERWAQIYPNSNMAHAQLAWACSIDGDDQSAAREAKIALGLDKQSPHREKKLREQRVYDPRSEHPEDETAEQLMNRLRN